MKVMRARVPGKLPADSEAETILKDLEPLVALTPTERDVYEWAYWPSIEQAESEDGREEMRETGDTLRHYLLTDMAYRLGEQLPDMAASTQGEDGYMGNLAKARAASRVADRITAIVEREG